MLWFVLSHSNSFLGHRLLLELNNWLESALRHRLKIYLKFEELSMSGKLMVKTCLLGKHPKQQQAYNSSCEPFLQSIAYQIIEKLNRNLAKMHICVMKATEPVVPSKIVA